jgi:hypothetical protein
VAALMAIFAEWQSGDTFSQRVGYLSGSLVNQSHYNGPLLTLSGPNQTVFGDGVTDTISASGSMNWIIP